MLNNSSSGSSKDSKSAHILLIEDDQSISLGLTMNLQAEGYLVSLAEDGEIGLECGLDPGVDLIILDVMLPKQNGFELVRELRNRGQMAPVIMLSARGAEEDKVMGLELGAEDYITKPFSLAELLARVKAALRRDTMARQPREPASQEAVVQIGQLLINVSTRQVFRAGKLVELTATQFDVLCAW